MRFKKYLPEFISQIKEFQELDKVLSIELDELRDKLQQIQDNQFVELADGIGLRKYEKMLSIPSANEITTRRFNILNKYNSAVPFSMVWLRNTLNTTVGRGAFLIDMDYNRYTLTISLSKEKEDLITTLYQDLRRKVPANLVLKINILEPIENNIYSTCYIQTADYINI